MIQLMVFGVLGVHGAHAAVSAPCLETDPVTTHLLSMGAKSVLETQQVILKINLGTKNSILVNLLHFRNFCLLWRFLLPRKLRVYWMFQSILIA